MSFSYDLLIIANGDTYPTYRWMQDNDPAHYFETADIWVLAQFEGVSNAFRDWEIWSSGRCGNLINDPPEQMGKTLGTTDPPRHTFARSIVSKAFTPHTVAHLKPNITLANHQREPSLQVAVYAGVPSANTAVSMAKRVYAKLEKESIE